MATKTQKSLAVGAAAGAAILAAYLVNKAAAVVSSCDPYILFVKPDGIVYYYRYDGSPLKWGAGNIPDGTYGGQGGSDHHEQYYLDGMLIPIFSGECPPLCGSDGYPMHIDPAPYRNVPLAAHPESTLCDKYVQGNGPRAKPCPSNQTIAQYSASVKAMPQWKLDPLCGHFPTPTPTPTGGVPQSPTPTKPPATLVASPVPTTPTPSPYADWVEALYNEGITSGCGPGIFCPTQPVTREQIAVFLLRVKHGSTYVPPKCVGLFTDVPCK